MPISRIGISKKNTKRASASLEPLKRVLIVSEGGKTEPNYFREVRKEERYQSFDIGLFIGGKNDPVGVIEKGISAYKEDSEYDIVFCLIDEDKHQKFKQALARAKEFSEWLRSSRLKKHQKTKFYAIPSYPCFEIWLLFHFEYTRKAFCGVGSGNKSPCSQVESRLRSLHISSYAKSKKGIYSETKSKINTAISNSIKAKKDAISTNRYNPSTDVRKIFTILDKIYKKQK